MFLVERGRRKSLGLLRDMNILKLMELLRERMNSHKGVIGLLLVDSRSGGAMHHPKIHKGRFSRNHYKGDSLNHVGNKNDKYIH